MIFTNKEIEKITVELTPGSISSISITASGIVLNIGDKKEVDKTPEIKKLLLEDKIRKVTNE